MTSATVPSGNTSPDSLHSPSLRERYLAYRTAQGRELLNLIPREGVRSVLRHLREGGGGLSVSVEGDVLDRVAARCGELLPLPPFEVWARDFHDSRSAYAAVPGPPLAPSAPGGEPVTVEVRTVEHQGEEWIASLALHASPDLWVGHIRFHLEGSSRSFRTGDIFRESSPTEVRERFRSFDDRTLNAFLRSALP